MIIKFFDSTLHHHEHFICKEKKIKYLHEYHEKCPIPSFVQSVYSLNKTIHVKQDVSIYEITINDIFANVYKRTKYSFSLRAPPFNIIN